MPREKTKHIITFYWFPFVAYAATIFYVSHQSDPVASYQHLINDKIIHAGEFFGLYFLTIRLFRRLPWKQVVVHSIKFSLFFALMYAALDEGHQLFIAGRDASLYDFMADSMGIIFGMVLFWKIDI